MPFFYDCKPSASSPFGRIFLLCALLALVLAHPALAQFEEKSVQVGQMGLHITNAGTVGRPNVRNEPQGLPSMEYPLNSGVEHLFEAGLWLGAYRGGSCLSQQDRWTMHRVMRPAKRALSLVPCPVGPSLKSPACQEIPTTLCPPWRTKNSNCILPIR